VFGMARLSAWLAMATSRFRSRRNANKRAAELLREALNPDQRAQYDRKGDFDVIGGQSGKRYRIKNGSQMNVDELSAAGTRVRVLCFVPQGGLPMGDIHLAQKLALELMEDETLKVARSGGWLGP
jgi:hypothetical protein